MISKAFADRNLAAGDVIRRKDCIACAARELKASTLLIDDHARCVISGACTPNESDVMAQQAEDEVHPVDGFNGSNEHSSANDFLSDLSYQNGVFEIMIESVAGICAQSKAERRRREASHTQAPDHRSSDGRCRPVSGRMPLPPR